MIWQSQEVSVQAHAQLHLQFLSSDKFQVALDSHIQVYIIQMKLTSFKSSGILKKQIGMYSSGIVTVSAAKTHLLYVCLEYVCCWL